MTWAYNKSVYWRTRKRLLEVYRSGSYVVVLKGHCTVHENKEFILKIFYSNQDAFFARLGVEDDLRILGP